MFTFEDLLQFTAFSRLGTLSKVAQELHISQPTLTRTMKQVEAAFGVPLFLRTSNQIQLNETGKKAVEYAAGLLKAAEDAVLQIQAFDRQLHTITVESCAPAPLWSFLPALSRKHPGQTISSELCEPEKILSDVLEHQCNIGILPYAIALDAIECQPLMEEHLSICVPPDHDLAQYKSVTCDMINGFNCLLSSEIGFWNELCREKMPSSRFLIQTDEFTFRELIRASSLPCFTTDLVEADQRPENRIIIPITDPEVNVTYYTIQPLEDTL